MDYWKPKSRAQLINWLKKYYPDGRFGVMEKRQLWSIFYKTIRRVHESNASRV